MSSLIDCFDNLSAATGIITETWLTDDPDLDEEIEDLVLGTGLQMIYRNRKANDRGFSHGGVAVIYKEATMNMKAVKLSNPEKYEVLLTTGRMRGCPKPLAVLACYLPPNYPVPRGRAAMAFIAGAMEAGGG